MHIKNALPCTAGNTSAKSGAEMTNERRQLAEQMAEERYTVHTQLVFNDGDVIKKHIIKDRYDAFLSGWRAADSIPNEREQALVGSIKKIEDHIKMFTFPNYEYIKSVIDQSLNAYEVALSSHKEQT